MPSNHLILCRPLLLLPSIFPRTRVFSNESVLPIRWPNYWSFSFSISPSNEYSGLISFGLISFPLVWSPCCPRDSQRSSPVPQFKSINSSVFGLPYDPTDHPYIATGKTIALTRRTSVSKVMSLSFNMLSRLVMAFFLRSKPLLILWLQSLSTVILEPRNDCKTNRFLLQQDRSVEAAD